MALKDQLLGQAPNDYQRQKLGPILDAHLAASADGIARHADEQQVVYGRTVAAAAIETSRAEALANPANLPNTMARAEGAVRVLYQGQAPEVVESEVRKAGASIVSAVIGDRLARNDPLGVTLFRQHGDRLAPSDHSTLGAAAETLSNALEAAAWLRERSAGLAAPPTGDAELDAVNAASASAAEPPPVVSSGGTLLDQDGIVGTRERLDGIEARRRALTALNEQEFAGTPVRLRANQAAIDSDTARHRAAVKAEVDGLYADLRRHLTTGGPNGGPAVTPPPATILSRLTDAQQDAVATQINGNIEGRRTATDPQTWHAIRQGLTGGDAGERQRWASTNLVPFMGRLSAEDYAALETLQAAVRSNDGGAEQSRLQNLTRMANDTLRLAGIDPTPRPDAPPDSGAAQAARFHRALQDELSAFDSKGREPTEAEAYEIVKGLKNTGIKSGWLKVSDRPSSSTTASDIPLVDEAFHKPGAQVAQAGSEDDKPAPRPDSEPSGTERELRIDAERMRQLEGEETAARGTVRGGLKPVQIDRWLSDWLSEYWPQDAAPPQMPAGLAERLTAGQRAEIEDIVSGGADTKTDPRVLDEIRRGLRSGDAAERLKWANKPLYRYRPLLSPYDYQQLTIEQAQIDPLTGAANGTVGHPFGTLDQHAALAIELSAARGVGWAYRAGRWALERITGGDNAPAGRDVATSEGLNATGVGGGATKAAETALSTGERIDVSQRQKVDTELPVPEIVKRVGEQRGEVRHESLATPNEKELAAGEAFAGLGYGVKHKTPSSTKGVQTPDLYVEGIGAVQVYSPQKITSVQNVLRTLEKKQGQAQSILVQTEFSVETMQSIAARLWGKPNATNIDTLFFQSPEGTIRRFDRPRKSSK